MRFYFGNMPEGQARALVPPLNSQLRADLAFLAFFNVAISGGDMVNIFWIVTHLPLHATVQNNGWELLWK